MSNKITDHFISEDGATLTTENGTTIFIPQGAAIDAPNVTKLSRAEMIARLKELKGGSADAIHYEADGLLIAYIDDPEIRDAFFALERWYE